MSIPDYFFFGSLFVIVAGLMIIVISIVILGYEQLTNNDDSDKAKFVFIFGLMSLLTGVFFLLGWVGYIVIRIVLRLGF